MAELKYLLDTSTCIELLRGNEHVRQLCVEHNQFCCISAITAIELLYGAYNAHVRYREQELAKARLLTGYYDIVGIDDIAVVTHNTKHFGRIEGLKTEDWML